MPRKHKNPNSRKVNYNTEECNTEECNIVYSRLGVQHLQDILLKYSESWYKRTTYIDSHYWPYSHSVTYILEGRGKSHHKKMNKNKCLLREYRQYRGLGLVERQRRPEAGPLEEPFDAFKPPLCSLCRQRGVCSVNKTNVLKVLQLQKCRCHL